MHYSHYLHYWNTRFALLKCTIHTICNICIIEIHDLHYWDALSQYLHYLHCWNTLFAFFALLKDTVWCQVLGIRYLVQNTWYQTPGTFLHVLKACLGALGGIAGGSLSLSPSLSLTLYTWYMYILFTPFAFFTYWNTRLTLLKCTIHTICTICIIEGLSLGEHGGPQGWGNQLEAVGGTSAGRLFPLPFQKLSKNPSRTSLVRECMSPRINGINDLIQ